MARLQPPALRVATSVNVYVPVCVGVPESLPVRVSNDSPVGNVPERLNVTPPAPPA